MGIHRANCANIQLRKNLIATARFRACHGTLGPAIMTRQVCRYLTIARHSTNLTVPNSFSLSLSHSLALPLSLSLSLSPSLSLHPLRHLDSFYSLPRIDSMCVGPTLLKKVFVSTRARLWRPQHPPQGRPHPEVVIIRLNIGVIDYRK
jgi:hypothetical protein